MIETSRNLIQGHFKGIKHLHASLKQPTTLGPLGPRDTKLEELPLLGAIAHKNGIIPNPHGHRVGLDILNPFIEPEYK